MKWGWAILPLLRKHLPDGATRARYKHTSDYSLLLIYRPRKDERLSWPSRLTCSGRFTHVSGHPSGDTVPRYQRCRQITRFLVNLIYWNITYFNIFYNGYEHREQLWTRHVDTCVMMDTRVDVPCSRAPVYTTGVNGLCQPAVTRAVWTDHPCWRTLSAKSIARQCLLSTQPVNTDDLFTAAYPQYPRRQSDSTARVHGW